MEKQRKTCNNKVEFTACGKSITMRLSDWELQQLRLSSIWRADEGWETKTYGYIYNFAVYALFDYTLKSRSKAGRLHENFPYHDFDKMYWTLL